ncbi:MAG: ATP-binding protein [Chromatiales bacterium]|nr:ATP-binding protein [Chromatiales bacterium]
MLPARPHLLEVCRQLATGTALQPPRRPATRSLAAILERDLRDVRGQHHAKRALEIAAAGGHNLLLIGPPGTGKTMLASRLPGILPPLSEEEALETAAIASVSAQGLDSKQWGVAAVPRAAPHRLGGGAGRRRRPAAARRDFAGPSRRAVPGRVAGVRPARAGGAARAAGIRADHHLRAPPVRPTFPRGSSWWRP